MEQNEADEWAIQVKLPRSAKHWLDQRARTHHRSRLGELRAIIYAAMATDLASAHWDANQPRDPRVSPLSAEDRHEVLAWSDKIAEKEPQ